MSQNERYEFTLVLDGVDDQTVQLEDQLFVAGCDDALINFRNGTVYLDFCREENTLEKAVISAIRAVESIPAGAKVISILPDDSVTESEIANRLGKSRQTVSLWAKKARRKGMPFPSPISHLSERSPMWRWFDVVQWLYGQQLIHDKKMLERARFIENINAVLGERDPEIQAYRHHILSQLQSEKTTYLRRS